MFTGSIVAVVTPMDVKGRVDQASFKKLVDYHVNSGTTAIVAVGTTGESATLDHDEHADVVMMALDLADGRIPVIAGTGANATSEAISLTTRFHNTGVAGCLTVTPYYNKPTQEGLYQHFKMIAEHTDLPQILYNVPGRTGCDMKVETVARLAKVPNIIGLKDATADLSRVARTRALVGDDFILLSGDDATFLDFMQLGGNGVISVSANVIAQEVARVCQLALEKRFAEARALNNTLMPLHTDLFVEPNPIPVKWACQKLGLIASDAMRLPLTPICESSKPVVEQALKLAGRL